MMPEHKALRPMIWSALGYLMLFGTLSERIQAQPFSFYEVQLQVTQTNLYYTNATPTELALAQSKVHSWSARCVFGPGKWLIESSFSPHARHSYFFDGTNVYHFSEMKPPRPRETKNEPQLTRQVPVLPEADVVPSDWIFLKITPGQHPLSNFGANLPWLAYCSGDYLRSRDRLIPLTGAEIRHVPASFGFKDKTEHFTDVLGLPRKSELLASVSLLQKSPLHESLLRAGRTEAQLQVALRPNLAFPDGFIAARYVALSHANFNDWKIPTEFSYEQFEADFRSTPLRMLVARGEVMEMHPSEEPRLELSASQRYAVVDYRFRHKRKLVDEIGYVITDGVIPNERDPQLLDLYKLAVSLAPTDPVIRARQGIHALFLVLVGVPAMVALWWRVTQNKQQRKDRIYE